MDKLFIQQMLRESLEAKIQEAEKDDKEGNKSFDELNKDEKQEVMTLTKKIHNATQGKGKLLKLSQVMDAAGVGNANSATDRSKIGKAVSGKPDADGKVRHLSKRDAATMGKVVDNPVAYLSNK
jgi:mannose/fructose/N-acetylgalactosamine-specific phosphotransferase system component IIB